MRSLTAVQSYIIRGLVFLLPLFFLPITADFFNLNKLSLLAIVSLLSIFSWGLGSARERYFSFRTNPMDIPAFLFSLGVVASAYFATQNKLDAFVFPGMATVVLASFVFYFLLVQYLGPASAGGSGEAKDKVGGIVSAWVWGVVIVSTISLLSGVGLFGLLGKFLPLPQWLTVSSYFSTVGGVIPSVLLFMVSAPLVFGRVMQAMTRLERSGGLSLSTAAYFGGFVIFVASLAFGIYQAMPGKAAEYRTLPFSSGWSIALETLKRQPFFGVGVGDFHEAFNRFRPIEYNLGSSWNLSFGASTNWYLDLFTTTGIVGLGLFGWLVWRGIGLMNALGQRGSTRSDSREMGPPSEASVGQGDTPYLKATLIAFLIVFLFSPANLTLIFFFFVLLGLLGSLAARSLALQFSLQKLGRDDAEGGRGANIAALVVSLISIVGLGAVLLLGGKVYAADVSYRKALNSVASGGKYKDVMDNLVSAITKNPRVDSYRIDYAQVSLALMREIAKKSELSDADKNDISQLVQLAIEQGKAGVTLNSVKSANWANLASIYRAIMPVVQGADQFTVQVYQQAIALEPTNPNLRIALGGVFYSLKNYDEAIKAFELAVAAKPNLANAHYNLAVALRDAGKIERAALELKQTMALVEPNSKDYEAVKKELDALGPQLEKLAQEASAAAQVARGEGEPASTGQGGQAPLEAPQPAPSPIVTPKLELPQESAPPEQ